MSLAEYNWQITTKAASETWLTGDYKILNDGSGTGTFATDSSQAQLTYIVEYTSILPFLDTVLGKTVKSGSSLLRSASSPNFDDANGSLPEEHPFCLNFFAVSAELDTRGTSSQEWYGPQWKKAAVTVIFRPPDYNIIADGEVSAEYQRFTTKKTEAQCDYQTTQGFFKFVDNSNADNRRVLDMTPGFMVSSTRKTYVWRQIPCKLRSDGYPELGDVPNKATIDSLVGKVNETTFDSNAPGTVLLVSWFPELVKPQVATSEKYYWNIGYIFGIRDYGASDTPYVTGEHIGWNYAFDPLQDKWRLYTAGDSGTSGTTSGKTQYKYGDLTDLFDVNW